MRIVPKLGWSLVGDPDEALDPRLLPLLEAIAASASLSGAVVRRGISYRAAWGLLRAYERKLGTALVTLERGRGARLTRSGEQLLRAQTTAIQWLSRIAPELALEIEAPSNSLQRASGSLLQIAASHDFALTTLTELLPPSTGIKLELSVMGSLHALREFAEGRADAAGFHVPTGERIRSDRAPFLQWLRPRRDSLVHFADRDQGLILPRGNPSRVRSLRDVAAANLRFVNRQRGSGTRLLIDRIIADQRIDGAALARSGNEEFTHPAVAATVASGGADAGFGLRAAAAEYGLAFVPLITERYFLAVRAKEVDKPPVARLIEVLRSAAFARHLRRFPGYRAAASGSGSVSGVEVLV